MTAALGGFSATLPARAGSFSPKPPPIAALYQTREDMFGCAVRTFFIGSHSGKLVSADTGASGWCTLFDRGG